MSNYKQGTKCIQSGYLPKNGEPRILPIYQSTTYTYDSADTLGALFNLKAEVTCIQELPTRQLHM